MADDGRRGDEDDRGPGAVHQVFVVMECLLEKLKVLNYEEEVLAKHNMKNLSRHYFVSSPYLGSNPGEQFYMFTIIAAWLINMAGRPFTEPQEYDEPNATVSNILAELRAFGVKVDFPPSKLKSGSGEYVCLVLDRLAEEALRRKGFSFRRPKYPTETTEEESVIEDDAELTLSKVEEEMIEEPDEEEENVMDLEALKLRTTHTEAEPSSKPDEILESTVDAAEWNLEVERVLPQLKVTIRTDNKDWRIHVDQMHQHRDGIKSSLKEAKSYLDKLQEDIGKTLEKVSSREKYINNQLEHLIQEYRSAQAKLSEAKERYQQASGGVTERTRVLAEISEELEKVKQEMEEKGSSMSDGAPVVKIKQSLTKLKQEIVQMDVRIGVVQHTLLQAKLKEKSNMTRDMHATNIPESAAGPFT
ncbi:intraflagellar transport protein 57 homolog [Seriola lalandi dorsalis]|uniref:Intraflagellar transport protein 57 homolog n=1 Tax=Seriola lalandi dorsalis TaxID=1841481 RepID=A0A3B4WF43_SERLL|nr:intraflagellar transport protein 57 homolog [Seriola lalandi dorsalis]XP_023252472.1 intraflagellar transport protein 57 homolog [Seriola lalandi dorsalis]XP_056247378.1 intraflagellar transport protein 57 homolog [Seriola aureovittata]XP_056247379.1 intraflagellar transport protein 57 homolog [Seriola aureovittata]